MTVLNTEKGVHECYARVQNVECNWECEKVSLIFSFLDQFESLNSRLYVITHLWTFGVEYFYMFHCTITTQTEGEEEGMKKVNS